MTSYQFQFIGDTPDLELHTNQKTVVTYSYMWGPAMRKRTTRRTLPMHIHMRDFLKIRENNLRRVFANEQLQGAPPTLFDIRVTLYA